MRFEFFLKLLDRLVIRLFGIDDYRVIGQQVWTDRLFRLSWREVVLATIILKRDLCRIRRYITATVGIFNDMLFKMYLTTSME